MDSLASPQNYRLDQTALYIHTTYSIAAGS